MALSIPKTKLAWEDRFATPTGEALREDLSKQSLALVDHLRASILSVQGVKETVAWCGVTWKWSLVFKDSAGRIVAYIVPQPAHTKLVLPLSTHILSRLPSREVSKWLRDGVTSATIVGDVRWAHWEFASKANTDELLWLLEARLPTLASH
jgi:hypothetical protein